MSRAGLSSACVPLGTVGLIFANWPNTRATKQLSTQVSLLPGHLVKMGCRLTFNMVLAQAEPLSAPRVGGTVLT